MLSRPPTAPRHANGPPGMAGHWHWSSNRGSGGIGCGLLVVDQLFMVLPLVFIWLLPFCSIEFRAFSVAAFS